MKIAFLTSYNLDIFSKKFEKFLANNNPEHKIWWNSYGLHEQSVYDETSSLYKLNPDLIIIHYEIEWLLGDLIYDVLSLSELNREKFLEEVKTKINSLVKVLIEKLPKTKIVFENYIPRSFTSLGPLDTNIILGINEIVSSLNNYLLHLKNGLGEQLIIHNYAGLVSEHGRTNCFDTRLYRLAKNPFATSFYNNLFVHYTEIIDSISSPRKKCIVVDLDNTLWGGVVGQDGFDKIEIGGSGSGEAFVQFQKTLLNYYRKGIFLAVCSKNNYDDALEVIEKHPDMLLRKEYFSSLKINWIDKASNIKSIAQDLNIGTDSIVFLDDNPAECELVKQQMPEVEVINLTGDPDNYIKQLLETNSLKTVSITEEDISRNIMHSADDKRKDFAQNFTNLDEYYKSLDMHGYIFVNDQSQISRIAQLTQKTNQFNLTTKRYSVEDIKKFMSDNLHRVYSLKLTDKFGDNGIVLVAIVNLKKSEWSIDSFLMSCRVIGRQAETALLNEIINDAIKENIFILKGEFIKTKKNAPAEEFYKNHEFELINDTIWETKLPKNLCSHYITIIRGK
jgi:FkbH-like protein